MSLPGQFTVGDGYTCEACGGTVFTTTGQQHHCPDYLASITTPLTTTDTATLAWNGPVCWRHGPYSGSCNTCVRELIDSVAGVPKGRPRAKVRT